MENKSYSAPESYLNKFMISRPSIGQSSRCDYFSDEHSVIPFKWEEEPGIPKEESSSSSLKIDPPPFIPPPPNLNPTYVPKHPSTQPKSCFFVKPWFGNFKAKKGNNDASNNDEDVEESFDDFNYIFSGEDFSSSQCVSKSSSGSSIASSKGSVSKSSRVFHFAKGVYKRLF